MKTTRQMMNKIWNWWRVGRHECDYCSAPATLRLSYRCDLDERHTQFACAIHTDNANVWLLSGVNGVDYD